MSETHEGPLLTLEQAVAARTYLASSIGQVEEEEAVLLVRLRNTQKALKEIAATIEKLDKQVIPTLKRKLHEHRERRSKNAVDVVVVE